MKAILLRDQGGNDGEKIDKKDLHKVFFKVLVIKRNKNKTQVM